MLRSLCVSVILCCVIFFNSSSATKDSTNLICGPNERLETCPSDCPADYCPKSERDNQEICSKPKVCPTPECKCLFNYRRADNGTCIPTKQCPPFECSRPNEEYNPCPPMCPSDNCFQATPTGRCPLPGRIGIVLRCEPACRCKEHYWRDNGVCVPYECCPNIREATSGKATIATSPTTPSQIPPMYTVPAKIYFRDN